MSDRNYPAPEFLRSKIREGNVEFEADTTGTITFSTPETLTTTFHVPAEAKPGQTIHALIQVTDNGTPALTSFQRVIVTVASR